MPVGEVGSLSPVPWPFLPQTASSHPPPAGQETAPLCWFLSAAFFPFSEKLHFSPDKNCPGVSLTQSGEAAGEEPTAVGSFTEISA